MCTYFENFVSGASLNDKPYTMGEKLSKTIRNSEALVQQSACEEFQEVAESFTMDLITNILVQIEIKCVPSTGCLSLIFPPFISIIMMLNILCEIPLDTKELIWGIKK